ncbi:DUF1360 domain-containing protein [soil metagenome]
MLGTMGPMAMQTAGEMKDRVVEAAKREEAAYSASGEVRPLGSFVGVMGVYSVVTVALGLVVRRRRALPVRFAAGDLALMAVATHRVSRLLSKDPVTSPLRAPFTTLEGTTGPAELKEEVRGTGLRKAVGELLTCPFCLAQWVATAFAFGLVLAPRATRLVASVFTTVAAADVLQFGYAAIEERAS